MAGHPSALELLKVSKGRPTCNPNSDSEAERLACGCTAPSWVSLTHPVIESFCDRRSANPVSQAAQWSEEKGLETLYKGYNFCSSSTMVRDVQRGIAMISGLYASGLMVVRE